MKKKLRWPYVIIAAIAIYAFGALFFISVTTLPHISLALNAQKEAAATMAEQFSSGTLDAETVGKNRKVIVYSANKELIAEYELFNSVGYSCEKETLRYFESGSFEVYAKPMIIIESNTGSLADRIDVIIYVAQPLISDGEKDGTLVLLADLISDVFFIENSFIGFNCVFFSFLICAIILVRKQRVLAKQKQNYIDNITHELKTPIASIKALTSALNDHEMDADTRNEYYGLILAEASRQEHMVQNILELSRIQSRDTNFKKSTVDARDVFLPICKRYSSLCDDLDIVWKEPNNLEILPALHTNTDCVQRILDLLLGNALRYTDENGLIELSISEAGKQLTVCISDNGNGISPEELDHIFERFFRGSNSYLKGGNGLGLAIAKELAGGLGEKIWAESKLGSGSKFYFTISK